MDETALQAYLPASFGGSSASFDVNAQIEKARRMPKAEKVEGKPSTPESDNSADDDTDDNEEEEDEEDEYPVTHEVVFKTHDKAVTTITLDPAGARMITGSADCTLKLHDFASMAPNTIRAFKSVDPTATKASASSETHPIHTAKFNQNSGGHVLCIAATPQARLLSRDGDVRSEYQKGDMYLRDMNMTKGHVSEITTGTWHPWNQDLFVTAGTDSTLRIWDVNTTTRQKDVIVHKSKAAGSGGRSRMTAVAWGSEVESQNSLLVSAALDGALLLWGGEGPYHRPVSEIRDAHLAETWTGGIDMSPDGRLVITRGGDDTIKLWDTRKFKTAVSTASHASTSAQFPTSNIVFGPGSSSILTGDHEGNLHILNPATLKPELVTPVSPGSPLITVTWHLKLNQIMTGSANAETHVLFSPQTSSRGALAILSKPPKRHHIDEDAAFTTDISQSALSGDALSSQTGAPIASSSSAARASTSKPNTGLTASGRSRDPRRPHLPAQTPFAKNAPDEKHIREHVPLSSMRDEDPREALLKYADKAKNDPIFTKAWAKTQPNTIYAEAEETEAGDGDGDGDRDGPNAKRQKR